MQAYICMQHMCEEISKMYRSYIEKPRIFAHFFENHLTTVKRCLRLTIAIAEAGFSVATASSFQIQKPPGLKWFIAQEEYR